MKSSIFYVIAIVILIIGILYLFFGQIQNLRNELDVAHQEISTLSSEIEQRDATIQSLEDLLKVEMVGSINFESGSAHLTEESQKKLDIIVQRLQDDPHKTIMVVGHTDDRSLIPIFPRIYGTNWGLSTNRATQVVRYFEEQRIDSARMKAAGKSKYHPIASNETADGRAQNRRAEIYLVPER